MISDEKDKLLVKKKTDEVPNEFPSNDQSSIQPLNPTPTPDVLAEEEIIDTTEYNWDDYDEFQIKTDSVTDPRKLEEIEKINKLTKYYIKYLLVDKKPPKDKEELKGLVNILKHQPLFAEDKFTWEIALPDMDPIVNLVKTTISKFSSIFDHEMLDHSLFQTLFPLKVIDQYLRIVNRVYGKPVYDKALRFQTNLLEIFLWHHLCPDTRFHSKITTVDINVIDPFLRTKIRERNRNDQKLKDKYFNSSFDLKKFVFMLLENYFPNVTWRYIGGGQEMHRWSLYLLLQIFELGLFKVEELGELVNVLLQKLENLLVLEKRSYQDFETSLKGYPGFNKTLKAYFYECKQIVAAICIQIAMLLNDQSFLESYPLFNPELKIGDNPNKEKVWNRAYFSNANIGNILNRIMTTYLFQLTEPLKLGEREKMFSLLNDFVMLTMDIENDVCYVSAKVVNQPLIEFYYWKAPKSEEEKADRMASNLENLLDQLTFLNLNKKKSYIEGIILSGLKSFLVELVQIPQGPAKDYFKNLLGLRGVPNIILALICALDNFKASRELNAISGLALTEVCKGSTINQVFATNEQAIAHWSYIFQAQKLTGVILQTSIFEGNYHLFYVHRSVLKRLLGEFKECLKPTWNLEAEDCNTHDAWFAQFKASVLEKDSDTQLDELIIFYLYCRFLSDLVSNRDMNYEGKFHNLEIQELLVKPFFGLFMKVILDPNFLPAEADEQAPAEIPADAPLPEAPKKFKFKTFLRNSMTVDLKEFVERKSTNGINESELRCAVFEVAMLTMKLLNKACTGLYPNWIFKYHVQPILPDFLKKTRYILDLPDCPTEYRCIILNFYTNFNVFPNNSLMSGRIAPFKDPLVPSRELRVITSHKDGTLLNDIKSELKEIPLIEKIWDSRPEEQSRITDYYYNGLLAMLYKYFKGVYCCYSYDAQLDKCVESIEALKEELMKNSAILRKFKVFLNFDNSPEANEGGGGLGGLLGGLNKILPTNTKKATVTDRSLNRVQDKDEFLYPKLVTLRNLCDEFVSAIENSIYQIDSAESQNLQEYTNAKYNRQSAIYCSKGNLEPWQVTGGHSSGVTFTSNKLNKSQANASLSLAKILLAETGLISTELRHFYSLMDIYQEQKFEYLNKPIDENIFLKFLESGTEYAPKMITFISGLVSRFFLDLQTKVEAEQKEQKEAYNIDNMIKTFLQNDIIYSMAAFFSKVIADCESLRNALYEKVADAENDEGKKAREMITVLYCIVTSLNTLVLNKSFMDVEFQIISEKYLSLTSLFKNFCENNCQKFKVFFGTFVPKLEGIPAMNSAGKPLIYDSYVKMETGYTSINVHMNKDSMLRVDDKPELLPYMSNWIKMVTEFVNGPCLQNQKQIYIFRTDAYTGTIKRMVDNVESTFYHHKNIVTEYIDGLMEGNNPDIMKHFASNFTFDILFDLICTSIKKLYVYSLVQGDKKKYAKLVTEAKAHKRKKLEEAAKKEESFKSLLEKQLEYYKQAALEEGGEKNVESIFVKTKQESHPTVEDFMDPRIITEDIMEVVKIDDYSEILDLYMKSESFSKHIILSTVFKLNDFLQRFTQLIAGYKICLENVYSHLIDLYGEDVPIYIVNKLGNYEGKENREKEEKLVIYMFLCKITAEIELANPSTTKAVKVYYPLIPKTFFLTKITKNSLRDKADPNAMTMHLVMNYNLLDIEMNYNLDLFRKRPILYFLSSDETFYYVKFLLWVLAFLLNLIMIVFYRRDSANSWIIDEGWYTIWALGAVIIFISLFCMFFWFAARYMQKVKVAEAESSVGSSSIGGSRVKRFYQLYIKETILNQTYPILFMFYIVCSFLGIFVQPFFFTLLLLTIATLSTTMDYVVKAITTHIDQLALTVILMLMVIYCYAMLSAEYFFDKLESNQTGGDFLNCTQLWECLTYVFNYGLRNGGGIGDASVPVDPLSDEGRYMAKFFFDVVFFFLVNVISLNIIFGIIIDTFADMRQKNDDKGKAKSPRICLGLQVHGLPPGENYAPQKRT
jgi:hypothetical protein